MAREEIPREISDAAKAASKAPVLRMMGLLELWFASGTIRLNSSNINIDWRGNRYYGIGDFGNMSTVSEGMNLKSRGAQFTLTGIKSDYLEISLDEKVQGRRANLFFAMVDENYHLVREPLEVGPWRMDFVSVEWGDTATITVHCENLMAAWNLPKLLRYTHEQHTANHPGDLFLEYIAEMPTRDFNWGETGDKVPKGMWRNRGS